MSSGTAKENGCTRARKDGPTGVKALEKENMGKRRLAPLWECASAALSYILVSTLMTILNKHIISKVKFPGTSFLLCSECLACTIIVSGGRVWKYRSPWKFEMLRFLGVCTFAKALNMYFSFLSMKYTSLPVYNVLKRLNPAISLVIDSISRGRVYSWQSKLGVFLILCGAMVTGYGDLDANVVGYATALVAVVCQASYLVLSSIAQDQLPWMTHVDVLFYTGFYNMLMFLPLALDEWPQIVSFWNSSEESSSFVLAIFALYCFQGIVLNYVTFWCTSVNSPVATGVCGNVKGLTSSLYAVFFFGVNLTYSGWMGFALNSAGGLLYTLSKIWEKKKGDDSIKKNI